MNKPELNSDNLLGLRGILSEKLKKAEESSDALKVSALLKDIEIIDMLLGDALYNTVLSRRGDLKIDTNIIDMSRFASFQKELGMETTPIEITESTQRTIPFDKTKAVDAIVETKEMSLKETLDHLLSTSFTKNISKAVDIYIDAVKRGDVERDSKAPELTLAQAWVEIMELVEPRPLYEGWHSHISNVAQKESVLHAVMSVSKHVSEWPAHEVGDLARLICINYTNGFKECAKLATTFEKIKVNNKFINKYKNDDKLIKIVKLTNPGFSDTQVSARIQQYAAVSNTASCGRIRKEYIEKGY